MNNAAHNLPAVAIVGRPNVGKSAIFNRLIGRKIAIVHDQPGITRDRISGICKRGSRPFVLWDTGGIFGAGEKELTAQVRSAAEEALHESDLLLFVVDAKDGLSPIDEELARAAASILTDEGERRERGAAARETFLRCYAPAPATQPLVELYRRMTS